MKLPIIFVAPSSVPSLILRTSMVMTWSRSESRYPAPPLFRPLLKSQASSEFGQITNVKHVREFGVPDILNELFFNLVFAHTGVVWFLRLEKVIRSKVTHDLVADSHDIGELFVKLLQFRTILKTGIETEAIDWMMFVELINHIDFLFVGCAADLFDVQKVVGAATLVKLAHVLRET